MGKTTKNREWFKALPFWRRAERTVAQQLRLKGVPCKLVARENRGWDIETSAGLRIEVKAGRLMRQKKKGHLIRSSFWAVSIARPHGREHRLREDGVSFYVIRLLGNSDLRKVYLVLPAPVKKKQLQVTVRQLLTKYRDNVNTWGLIVEADKARGK